MFTEKFYIKTTNYHPDTINQAVAYYGFKNKGVETIPFYNSVSELKDLSPSIGVAGTIQDVLESLKMLNKPLPDPLDYPEELEPFFGREIFREKASFIRSNTEKYFIKPFEHKQFNGFVLSLTFNDQIKTGHVKHADDIWVSDIVNFISEYRCFILEGNVIGVKHYKGDWSKTIDKQTILNAVKAYKNAPIAYTLDFGVTDTGKTLLVEANDGFAMGAYGLQPELYSAMLAARWYELNE